MQWRFILLASMRFLNGCTFNVFSLSCLDRISIYLLTFVFLLIQLYILCLMGENLNYLDLNIFLEERVCMCVWWREAKKKKGVVFWDPPDICVSSNVELPLVYFLSMQTNPKIGLLQCSASGNDNSTCIKQLPLSQFYLLLLYFSINPLFIQTNACHATEWQYMLNVLLW